MSYSRACLPGQPFAWSPLYGTSGGLGGWGVGQIIFGSFLVLHWSAMSIVFFSVRYREVRNVAVIFGVRVGVWIRLLFYYENLVNLGNFLAQNGWFQVHC